MQYSALFPGLLFGFSLIVAIGPQNVLLLRQGLLRQHVGPLVSICTLSDAVLITTGVSSFGAFVDKMPHLLVFAQFAGAAVLVTYGLMAARRVFQPVDASFEEQSQRASRRQVITTCLAFTWLNPHVYLDTLVLIGSVANSHGSDRGWFAAGVILASCIWFTAIGYGARWLRPLFSRPNAWRIFDAGVAATMLGVGLPMIVGA